MKILIVMLEDMALPVHPVLSFPYVVSIFPLETCAKSFSKTNWFSKHIRQAAYTTCDTAL
jgi:hypothetical protein